MKVAQLMTPRPVTCRPETNLAEAAALMLQADCGILPVVAADKLVGVVTDRDLFIALATRDQRPSSLAVADVVTGTVVTCGPDDEPASALALMKQHQVRRMPVLGLDGNVVGVVAMNDLVLAAGQPGVRDADIIATLQGICAHRHPAPNV